MDKKGVFEDRRFKLKAVWKKVCYRQEEKDSNEVERSLVIEET